jgi:NhaP-type Na+/H+ or K+/H+ antiporter
MFGSILSATDPVAVVALLKELGVNRKLSTLIEGESLLNDGTALVAFEVFRSISLGHSLGGDDIIVMFVRLSIGGPLLGLIFGMVMS